MNICIICPFSPNYYCLYDFGQFLDIYLLNSYAETCLLDVKKMEPIDGLSRITKVTFSCIHLLATNLILGIFF